MLRNTGPRAGIERALHLPVMADAPPSATRWRIADLVLDLRRQRVWRDHEEIPLPKLTYALFVALVRRCPDVVADEDLMKAVWPGVIVSPETVSQRVKLLRQALKDDPRAPRYVGRLRGRGYHLVPMAVPIGDEAQTAIESALAVGNSPRDSEEWAANPAARDAVISMFSPRSDELSAEESAAAAYIDLSTEGEPDDSPELGSSAELVPMTELFPPEPGATTQSARNSLLARIRALVTHLRRR